MTTKYRSTGSDISYTAGADIVANAVVIKESLIGVAVEDIANGAVGRVAIEGEWELPAVSGAVITQGEKVLWDISAGAFDDDAATAAAGDISGGAVALADSGNGVTTVRVRLVPGAGVVEAG